MSQRFGRESTLVKENVRLRRALTRIASRVEQIQVQSEEEEYIDTGDALDVLDYVRKTAERYGGPRRNSRGRITQQRALDAAHEHRDHVEFSVRKGQKMTAAQRAAHSAAMKRFWRGRRARLARWRRRRES